MARSDTDLAVTARKSLLWILAAAAAAALVVAQLGTDRVFAAACSGVTLTASPTTVSSAGQITYSLATSLGNLTTVRVQYTPAADETYVSNTDPDSLGCTFSSGRLQCGGASASVPGTGTFLSVVVRLASSVYGMHNSGTFAMSANYTGIGCSGSYTTTTNVQLGVTFTGTSWNVGVPSTGSFVASNATGAVTFTTAGSLPPGVHVSSNGVMTGAPTALGTYVFSVTATDSTGASGFTTVTATVLIGINPSMLPPFVPGTPYDVQITGQGGTAPYTCTVVNGSLPSWATLSSSCHLTGTPPATASAGRVTADGRDGAQSKRVQPFDSGSTSFGLQLQDSGGNQAIIPLSLTSGTSVPSLPTIALLLTFTALLGIGWLLIRRRALA